MTELNDLVADTDSFNDILETYKEGNAVYEIYTISEFLTMGGTAGTGFFISSTDACKPMEFKINNFQELARIAMPIETTHVVWFAEDE
jgi:hypothetical protein